MLHLPILQNRQNQFEAQFARRPQGDWLWYANDRTGGVVLSDEEHGSLVIAHMLVIERVQTVLKAWAPVFFLLIVILVVATQGRISDWWGGVLAVLPLPWALWRLWQAGRLPHVMLAGRIAIEPPRGLAAGTVARLVALPITIPLAMIAVGGLLLWRMGEAGVLASEPGYTALGAGVMVFGTAVLVLRWR